MTSSLRFSSAGSLPHNANTLGCPVEPPRDGPATAAEARSREAPEAANAPQAAAIGTVAPAGGAVTASAVRPRRPRPRSPAASRPSTRWTPSASRGPYREDPAAGSAVPSELTAASRIPDTATFPSGHGSGCRGSRSSASPDSISGCCRAHPVPGGIMPAVMARAALTRLAMPAAARAYPMPAATAPSAAVARPPRLSCANMVSSARSPAAVPVPSPSMSWMSAGSIPARR